MLILSLIQVRLLAPATDVEPHERIQFLVAVVVAAHLKLSNLLLKRREKKYKYEVGCRPKDFPRIGKRGGRPRVEIYPGGASWEQRRLPVVPSFPTSSVTFPALHAEDISSQCGKGCSPGVVGRSLAARRPYFVPGPSSPGFGYLCGITHEQVQHKG